MSLLNKLRLKPGQRILFLNPPVRFPERLGELPDDISMDENWSAMRFRLAEVVGR